MKRKKVSLFFKQMLAVMVAIVKAKSMAVKNKTSAMKSRLFVFNLIRNKKVLIATAISHKIQALVGSTHDQQKPQNENSMAIDYNDEEKEEEEEEEDEEEEEEDDEDEDDYPDLRHSLFDEEDDGLGDFTGSVIDFVRNGREEDSEFRLEDEINHVADVFIRRFHKQMRLQKLESFKRHMEMMERSA